MEKVYGVIYKIVNIFNEKVYIGQTVDFERRKKDHLKKGGNSAINDDLLRDGSESFEWHIVQECADEFELNHAEMRVIQEHIDKGFKLNDTLYNKNMGSSGNVGWCPSEESRRKMSDAHKGNTHSEETRRKMGEAHKGITHSEETRRKIGEAHKGKPKRKIGESNRNRIVSEESRKKIGEANRNRIVSEETRRKMGDALKNSSEELKKRRIEGVTRSYRVFWDDGTIKTFIKTRIVDIQNEIKISNSIFRRLYKPRKPHERTGIIRIIKYDKVEDIPEIEEKLSTFQYFFGD